MDIWTSKEGLHVCQLWWLSVLKSTFHGFVFYFHQHQTGAWGCFDEFNRINIEVLSVVAQQILCILSALSNNQERFTFEGREINLVWSCGLFITMNPGKRLFLLVSPAVWWWWEIVVVVVVMHFYYDDFMQSDDTREFWCHAVGQWWWILMSGSRAVIMNHDDVMQNGDDGKTWCHAVWCQKWNAEIAVTSVSLAIANFYNCLHVSGFVSVTQSNFDCLDFLGCCPV